MADSAKLRPRGVLHLAHGRQSFHLDRVLPATDIADLVEHFWLVDWDLRDKAPYVSETLPHPSVHLVLEAGKSGIVGVMRGRFTRRLEGLGRVFGIKFLPGAFHALCGSPVSHFSEYVGVSPKWVIERYRMHEALEQLSGTEPLDLARLALSLGFFDQAHFQKAFRKMTGKSPGTYARVLR